MNRNWSHAPKWSSWPASHFVASRYIRLQKMKTIANLQKCPTVAELDNLCNALNDGRIALRDLKSQVASLLDNQQVQEICLIMCQLCVDNPGYYRDERCVDLWTDA